MFSRGTAVHHDDERALSTEEIDEQLEEGVDGEGLVDVTDGIEELGGGEGHERHPRRDGVDGNHE